MYIRKIIINNITSLKGEHVIDFTREPLRSADLFAITGDTGAGKSTILKSITRQLKLIGGEVYLDSDEIRKLSYKRLFTIVPHVLP